MKLNPCSKCTGTEFQHLLVVLQCTTCGEICPVPEDDFTGLDVLLNRKSGTDIAFIPKVVSSED